ncbi:MAG: DUF5597 domain-containing protein [Asticcacaulis sp.]|uniref:DUF5597 domain-containing protein n=1 Tax=Asticcacaulis sp. TaxID=1872648 RepID=UPI0039E5E66F
MRLGLLSLLAVLAATPVTAGMPHLANGQLIVDGKPFLILGGELGNSSASDPKYLDKLWPRLDRIGLNTLLVPVEWDQIEPVQGQFDFTVLDGVLAQARTHNTRVVLLWFGAWKNSMSTYAPAWVKHDPKRFSKAKSAAGETQDILSPFDPDNLAADQAAFVALMTHLKATDPQHTVLMIQVENEIGMLPDARDYSVAYKGQDDEAFQAKAFARYVEAEVKAGKAVYPLPMYVNAALNRPGKKPGEYPSGGPLPHLFDIWKKEAPSLDLLAPDIYFPDFVNRVDQFAGRNTLFIPEANQAGSPEAAANALYAIGEHRAIGFSPFSIEDLSEGDPLVGAYAMINQLSPLILSGKPMKGLRPPVDYQGTVDETPQTFTLGGYSFTASFVDPWTPKDKQNVATHGAILIQTGPDEFIAAGSGVTLTFATQTGRVGIEQVIEGTYEDGQFVPGRWLNGDQTHQGRHVRLPLEQWSIQKLKLYRYE